MDGGEPSADDVVEKANAARPSVIAYAKGPAANDASVKTIVRASMCGGSIYITLNDAPAEITAPTDASLSPVRENATVEEAEKKRSALLSVDPKRLDATERGVRKRLLAGLYDSFVRPNGPARRRQTRKDLARETRRNKRLRSEVAALEGQIAALRRVFPSR